MANKFVELSYHGIDEQLRKLAQFDQVFIEEMGASMKDATAIAAAQAKVNAPKLTGALAGSISNQLMSPLKNTTVRGYIGAPKEVKAKVQEYGRWYRKGPNPRYWKGKFFLYFAPKDKSSQIMALYAAANERIINKLVVR